jgi:hypothetical protein
MLTIRDAQMSALERDIAERFEKRAALHLQKSFPAHCKMLGEGVVRQVVRYGIERATSHQIAGEAALRLYLDLMFTLGSDFDRDPQLPWAAEILNDEIIPSPSAKLDLLCSRSLSYLEKVAGAKGEHFIAAVRRVRAHPWFTKSPDPDRPSADDVDALLGRLYPEKHRTLREQGTLGQLIAGGQAAALGHGVTDPWGVQVFTALMFMLGSAFDSDPQYPWVAALLTGALAPEPAARADRLCRESLSYVDRLLVEMGEEPA